MAPCTGLPEKYASYLTTLESVVSIKCKHD